MLFDSGLIWKALSDPTRRQILEKLADEPETTGEIVAEFAPRLVRTAVMKHLGILESAGLIRVERVGRTRWNHLERKPLVIVSTWLDRRMGQHRSHLKSLKDLAEASPDRSQEASKP